jgi:hypothetical protein
MEGVIPSRLRYSSGWDARTEPKTAVEPAAGMASERLAYASGRFVIAPGSQGAPCAPDQEWADKDCEQDHRLREICERGGDSAKRRRIVRRVAGQRHRRGHSGEHSHPFDEIKRRLTCAREGRISPILRYRREFGAEQCADPGRKRCGRHYDVCLSIQPTVKNISR